MIRGVCKRITIGLFVVAMFVAPLFSFAQQLVTANDISLQLNPKLPGPLETVEARLNSFAVNLDAAEIFWFVNGVEVASGIGRKNHSFVMGDVNEVVDLNIRVRIPNFGTIDKRVRLRPAGLDLLWEAPNSYVPPFYRGKALPAAEGEIRVTAVPHDISVTDDYVYTWRRNDLVMQDDSGYKRNAFTMKNNFFNKNFEVQVDVYNRTTGARSQERVIVPRYTPKLLFAVESPLTGLTTYQDRQGDLVVNTSSALLNVYPYYFSTQRGRSFNNLNFAWEVNGEEVLSDNTGAFRLNQIVVDPLTAVGGSGRYSVSVTHPTSLLQEVEKSINLRFLFGQ